VPASSALAPDVEYDAISWVLLATLIAGTAARVMWLAAGLIRLRRFIHLGDPFPLTDDEKALQGALGVRAGVRAAASIRRPVTFGVRSPLVLVPVELHTHSAGTRRAVLCHEFLHIQRKDWAWLLGEEAVRAVFWFHPAMWWLISQVQAARAAREEVVDARAVSITGSRRGYIAALLEFSDNGWLTPAPAFGRRRLFRRIRLISQEPVMSDTRVVMSSAVIALAILVGGWCAVAAFPLEQDGVGPGEQKARAITRDNPVPGRIDAPQPGYPQALVRSGLQAFITAQIVLDESGRVAETRRVYAGLSRMTGYTQSQPSPFDTEAANLFWTNVDDALRRWYYEAPRQAPIAFPVSFLFAPDRDGLELNSTPTPFTPAPAWHVGAVKVGDGVAPPRKIKDVPPAYPAEAQRAKAQGVVIVEARVEPDGRVSHSRIMRSIPELDGAALDAVSQWQFSPTVDTEGRPIAIVLVVTVRFTLS
jgi:TonB family protein